VTALCEARYHSIAVHCKRYVKSRCSDARYHCIAVHCKRYVSARSCLQSRRFNSDWGQTLLAPWRDASFPAPGKRGNYEIHCPTAHSCRVGAMWVSPHHPPAEKNGHTKNRAGKRTWRPERVDRVAGGSGVVGCVAGWAASSVGTGVAMSLSLASAMM
jgi:hypothetical protein